MNLKNTSTSMGTLPSDSMKNSSNSSMSTPTLTYECCNAGHIMSLYIKVHGSFILVGDLMRSMTLLQYKPPTPTMTSSSMTSSSMNIDGSHTVVNVDADSMTPSVPKGTLVEVARDFGANMMRAIEIIGDSDDYFLGSDDMGNLFSVKRNLTAETEEEKGKLDPFGYFYVGDWINVVKQGSLNTQPRETASATTASTNNINNTDNNMTKGMHSYLFGTANGAIGTIFTLDEDDFKFLQILEKAIKSVVTSG